MIYQQKDITVAIISNAKNPKLYSVTLDCIKSIQQTSPGVKIVVYESSDQKFEVETQKVEFFNYNKICNRAVIESSTKLVVLANNDLIFMDRWSDGLLYWMERGNMVVSPVSPGDPRQKDILRASTGYQCGRHFSGWCFMIHIDAWLKIGGFDEDFQFWCADNAILEQLKEKGITPLVDPTSRVKHLVSQTLRGVENYNELTTAQVRKFNKKYNKNLFNLGI